MSIFDTLAKDWDLNSNRVKNATTFVSYLKKVVDIKDKKIIDCGAGTGLLSFLVSDEAKEVLAIDNSKGMLDELNKKLKNSNVKNIKTALLDIEKSDLPTRYDILISSMTLHHIKDIKRFLEKVKTALNKDGIIAISDLISEDGSFHSRGNEGVFHFGFDLEDLSTLFQEVGFEVIYKDIIHTIKKDKDFPIFLMVGKSV